MCYYRYVYPIKIDKSKNSRRHTKTRPRCAFLHAVIRARSANVSRRPNTRPATSTGLCGDGTPAHCAFVCGNEGLLVLTLYLGFAMGCRKACTDILRCRGSPGHHPRFSNGERIVTLNHLITFSNNSSHNNFHVPCHSRLFLVRRVSR